MWRRCLRAFLGTGRQVRFTLFAAGFFHEFGRSQQKNLGMFLQMKPLFQISTVFCSFTSVPQGLWEWIWFPIHFPLKVFPQIRQPVGHCLCDHVAVTWQTPYLAEKETGLLFASSLWNLVANLVMILQWQPKLWIVAMQIGALILWYCSGSRLWRTQSSGWGIFVNVKAEQTNPLANNTDLRKLHRFCTFKVSFEGNHSQFQTFKFCHN